MKSKNQELDYFKEKAKRIKINASFAKDSLITKKEMAIRKIIELSNKKENTRQKNKVFEGQTLEYRTTCYDKSNQSG